MTRREFRLISGQGAGPSIEDITRRPATRRHFKTLHIGVVGVQPDSNFPITIRAFNSVNGSMLWEHENFYTTGRSPDNTVWGWGVRKITPSGYTNREIHEVPIDSGGTQPGGSTWPAKTNPAGYGNDTSTVAIDLIKITESGTKTTLVSDWLVYSDSRNPVSGSIWSDYPIGGYTTARPALYHANNDGRVMNLSAQSFGVPQSFPYSNSGASIVIEDPVLNGTTMKMTIRADSIQKHSSAGLNNPMWVFRRASTNASFPLYGTAAEVETALESLPGVVSVTATGGPCCVANMHVEIEWASATNTFSDAWITYSSKPVAARVVTDWNTGGPSHVMGVTPQTFTSDGTGVILEPGTDGVISRRNLTTGTPFGSTGSNIWTSTPFTSMTQTNERTKIGAGTTWDPVPRTFAVQDVRGGVVLVAQTRSRVPVTEPSGSAMTTHCTINDSSGSIIDTHDSFLNVRDKGWLTESGDIAAYGAQYGFAYQGGDEGVVPPPGNSFDSSLGTSTRSHSGRTFATGTGSLFEPFSPEAEVFALSDSYAFAANPNGTNLNSRTTGFDWNFEAIGQRSANEYRSAGEYVACRWTSFTAGTPDPVLPAHKRESWLTFSSPQWFAVPSNLEYRYVHRSGGSNVKTTAWFGVSATVTDVDDELQLWYGEPLTGYPTISIVGTIEDHAFQTQPFWQYMPLAHIAIWTDATGATFAPEGRVLGLEFRNGTGAWNRCVAAMTRTNGEIIWQKNAGLMNPNFPVSGLVEDDPVGGSILYALDSQVTVQTLCKPVVQATS